MQNKFIARKWSDNPSVEKPYDVVYLDYANNNQHFHPDMMFALLVDAEKAAADLNSNKQAALAKQWPVDGPVLEVNQEHAA